MIDTVILDFGYVLAYPRSGNWFMTPKTKRLIGWKRQLWIALHSYRRKKVLADAFRILDEEHLMHTEEEEIANFKNFYECILRGMGIRKNVEQLSLQLAKDLVTNDERIDIYEDVIKGLKDIKSEYRLCILSDNWPSLYRIVKNTKLEQYISGLINSCDHGICKDDIKLFEIAIEELKLKPERSVFIDDSIGNLQNARKAGLLPVLMDRKGRVKHSEFPIVHSMKELSELLAKLN